MTLDELREKAVTLADWPAECRLPEEDQLIKEFRAALRHRMSRLVDFAEQFDRDLTAEERQEYDGLRAEFDALEANATA